jgi:hypothetical protein
MISPALTHILCISCINSIQCSKLRKCGWCPGNTSAFTWTMCVWGYICAKILSSNSGSYSGRPTPPLIRERISEHMDGLGTNETLVMCPDSAWNQEWLCWREPAKFTGLYWTNDLQPRIRSSSPGRGMIFLFSMSSRLVLGPTQSPMQLVYGALPMGVKRPSMKLTTHLCLVPKWRMWGYTSVPACLHGIVLNYLSLYP